MKDVVILVGAGQIGGDCKAYSFRKEARCCR